MYRPDPSYNQFCYPARLPMQLETAHPNPPALTFDETSPFSTSQPSVEDSQGEHQAKGAALDSPEIRIEVTDH